MNLIPSEKELARIEKRIVSFLERYKKGFVLGISGGLDSAVCAILARKATPDVAALFLPQTGMTPSSDLSDARALCEGVEVSFTEVDISDIVCAFQRKIKVTDAAGRNIAPRVRMTLLYQYAQSHGVLVLGTSNRTELLLGYFTKYGDGGSDLCPLGGLLKTQVRALARHVDVPRAILEKTPSAGLYPGQTDEGELGASYDTIDAILHNHFDRKKSAHAIARMLPAPPETVAAILEKVSLTDHKRRVPPFPRFT